MRISRIVPYILTLLILSGAIFAVSHSENPEASTPSSAIKIEDMRGVWVTYMTLDVENESDKETAFKTRIDDIISEIKQGGFNTLIVQVRPFCDAIYESNVYPWSHILTGTQGESPGYDPLKYICDSCHKNGIAVHAWVNPYRVKTANTPEILSDDNPYINENSIGFELNGAVYLKPHSKEVQALIVNGIKELVDNYEIDGVQFDDYFYPENCGDFDNEAYKEYKAASKDPHSLTDWRMEQVNTLIKAVYNAVHTKKDIIFGISPQGNLSNNKTLYADVERWCAEHGYIDYICPQIYFSLDNPALSFEDSLHEWTALRKHKDLKLYIGLAGYKAGTQDADNGTWADNADILKTEIELLYEQKADGFMLYSYDSFHNKENEEEIQNVIRYLNSSPTQ